MNLLHRPLLPCPPYAGLAAILVIIANLHSFAAAGSNDASPSTPNIVLIMADDLGYGDLGCYGQTKIATPRIDRLAREGLRFTQFYSGSTVCAPSRCVLMTGLHTGHCFIRGNGKDNLRPEDVTVGEVLQQAGYVTAMFGKWGLGHEGSTGIPTRQGFDLFFGYLDQRHAHNYYPTFLLRNEQRIQLSNTVPGEGKFGQGVATKKTVYSHDVIMDEALSFVRTTGDKPYFLYLPVTIPHANNEAGRRGMEVPSLGQYADRPWSVAQRAHAAMISKLDRDVGRLLDLIDELGQTENTLVFFTSDNGPHREGGNKPEFANSNGPLRGIKRSLHEGGIRVPLIAKWPSKISAAQTTDWIGSFQDFMATFADVAGVSAPMTDGVSFAPTLQGDATQQTDHGFLYWAFYERGGARALRAGNWKAIQQPIDTPLRLYRLDQDLGETKNLAAEYAGIAAEFEQLMDGAYAPSDRWKFPKRRRR